MKKKILIVNMKFFVTAILTRHSWTLWEPTYFLSLKVQYNNFDQSRISVTFWMGPVLFIL